MNHFKGKQFTLYENQGTMASSFSRDNLTIIKFGDTIDIWLRKKRNKQEPIRFSKEYFKNTDIQRSLLQQSSFHKIVVT